MLRNYEEFVKCFIDGREQIRKDEYQGTDRLPYCKACKSPRFFVSENREFATRCICKCQAKKNEEEESEQTRKKNIEAFNKRMSKTLIGERYKGVMFSTAKKTPKNKVAFEKMMSYAKNMDFCLKKNIGLYVYGDNSAGKTYLTACLCNELVYKGAKCIYTNLASILACIRKSYGGKGFVENGEERLLSSLQVADFVFLDDVGKEFIGREQNEGISKWAEGKLFEIINGRYNSNKPTIFSSNYSIGELESVIGLDKGIVERIDEMATRVIKLEGDDFRKIEREKKGELAKKLGI